MFIKSEYQKGQGLLEFVLIIAMVAVSSMLALNLMGISVKEAYASVLAAFTGDNPCQTYYANTFEEGLDDWTRLKTRGFWRGNFSTKNGQLIGNSLGALVLNQYTGSDYTVNVQDPQLEKTRNKWNGYGVIFRADYDKRNRLDGYMFEVERVNKSDPGKMYFSKWENGYQVQPPLAAVEVPSDFDWNKPGNLSVVAKGNTFSAYVDGEKILETQDDTYKKGKAGIVVNAGSRLTINDFGINDPVCQE